jgi:hypothetical protein
VVEALSYYVEVEEDHEHRLIGMRLVRNLNGEETTLRDAHWPRGQRPSIDEQIRLAEELANDDEQALEGGTVRRRIRIPARRANIPPSVPS